MRYNKKHVGYNTFTTPSPGGLLAFVMVLIILYLFFHDRNFFYRNTSDTRSNYTGYNDRYPDVINVARVLSVYNGNTMRVEAVEMNTKGDSGVLIRLRGIDAPEIEGSCHEEINKAIASRDWLVQAVSNASQMQLVNVGYDDQYRSVVAHVLLDGVNISELSVESGHSLIWNGGHDANWCE